MCLFHKLCCSWVLSFYSKLIIYLFSFLSKKHNKVLEQARQSLRGLLSSRDVPLADYKQDLNVVEEVIWMILEIISSCLPNSLHHPPNLVYALLYTWDLFEQFFLICFFFFKLYNFYLFIYLFMAVLGLRFPARAFSSCGKWGPLFIAVRGPFIIAASLVAEHRLQTRRLSNCGSWAELLRGMWDLPRPGLEPMSPALAGRFSTTAPPGKPLFEQFWTHPSFQDITQNIDLVITFFSSRMLQAGAELSLEWVLEIIKQGVVALPKDKLKKFP